MSDMEGIAAKIAASSSVLKTQADQLIRQLNGQSQDHLKIEKAAQDFESVLLGHWLEQAQQSFATVPGGDPDEAEADPGQDQFRSIAMQALARSLTKSGGVGMAKMIVRQLEHSAGASEAPSAGPPKDGNQTEQDPG